MGKEKMHRENSTTHRGAVRAGGRILFRSLFVEFLMVALGVFLALLANQWSENRAHRKRGEKALRQIELEIRANKEALSLFHENNGAALDAMEQGGSEDGGAKKDFTPALQLSASSWNTLLSTGTADYLDFDTIQALSSLYSTQEVYRSSALLLVEAGLQVSAYAVASGKEVSDDSFGKEFMDYMKMIFQIEEKLLDAYTRVMEKLPHPGWGA